MLVLRARWAAGFAWAGLGFARVAFGFAWPAIALAGARALAALDACEVVAVLLAEGRFVRAAPVGVILAPLRARAGRHRPRVYADTHARTGAALAAGTAALAVLVDHARGRAAVGRGVAEEHVGGGALVFDADAQRDQGVVLTGGEAGAGELLVVVAGVGMSVDRRIGVAGRRVDEEHAGIDPVVHHHAVAVAPAAEVPLVEGDIEADLGMARDEADEEEVVVVDVVVATVVRHGVDLVLAAAVIFAVDDDVGLLVVPLLLDHHGLRLRRGGRRRLVDRGRLDEGLRRGRLLIDHHRAPLAAGGQE